MNRIYNVAGKIASGVRPIFSKAKIQGSKNCKCGRTISANAELCRACKDEGKGEDVDV